MLSKYQKQIDDSVQKFAVPYWSPLSNLAHLIEEVGEVSRMLNAEFGDKPMKPTDNPDTLAEEIADVIYSALCLANSQGIDMDEPMRLAIGKLETRDKDRFEKKAVV